MAEQLRLFDLSDAAPVTRERRRRKCECGDPKSLAAEACARCLFLDGETLQDAILVDALRKRGGIATTDELEQESCWSHRQVLRALERLKDDGGNGRVQRLETGAENHVNMPTFFLTNARAPRRIADQREPWGQLVIAPMTAICRHGRREEVFSGVTRCPECGTVAIEAASHA